MVSCQLLGVRSLVLVSVHIGQVTTFLETSDKTNVFFLFSTTFYLCRNGLLKVRALRMGYPYISGHRQRSFTKGAEPA